jgi:hypothetical protein
LSLRARRSREVGEDCIARSSLDSYALPNIIRVIKSRMTWTGHVELIGEMRNTYEILIGRPEGMRPLGRHRSIWRIILEWVLGK